jgi:spore germination protein YaaH
MVPAYGNPPRDDSSISEPDLLTDCEIARQFIDHLFNRDDLAQHEDDVAESSRRGVDWKAIEAAVAGSHSVEQEVGRSIVVADLMSRGVWEARKRPKHAAPRTPLRSRCAAAIVARSRSDLAAHKGAYSIALSVTLLLLMTVVAAVTGLGGSSPAAFRTSEAGTVNGNSQLLSTAALIPAPVVPTTTTTTVLPAATAPPAPAPPSLADAPPLRPHEVFGFAPYWTLPLSAGFNVAQITTIAYFSVGVNPDGTLDESGSGWNGYESQALANLVTRAHSAGDRVVLTVNNFDQAQLNALTSSPTAPSTLASALIGAIQAKNLDGVNLDLEGQGSGDQAGLTNLVTQVSAAVHKVNPDYQVTMDTYASSAGDPNGFYNIRALAPAVDAFFVMEYQLNLESGSSPVSPLTSTMFGDKTAIDQYTEAVPPAKVILGMPFFGIDWPTSDGTLSANATGPAATVSYGQIMASGHPIYWDATTDTGWTSYEVGTQWHETFFEVPSSLYDAAQLAASSDLGGMGTWALGMDGNDPNMLIALGGLSPPVRDTATGPQVTSPSSTTSTSTSSTTTTTTAPSTSTTGTPSSSTDPSSTTSTSTTDTPSSSTDPSSTTSTSTSSTATSTTTTSTSPSNASTTLSSLPGV